MQPSDLTIEILRGIRDEVHGLSARVDATNAGLNALRDDMKQVKHRETQTEVRLASEIVAVVGAVRGVRDLLREGRAADHRIDDHERRIAAQEQRVAG
jgi:hypothetical protein